MDDSIPRSIILLIILILAGGFFAGAETSFSYCNTVRIKLLAEGGNKNAKRVTWIIDRFERTVVTLLIAVNLIHISAASIATVMAVGLLGNIGSVAATVVLTLAVFLFSENIPKNIARANADTFSMIISLPILWFIYLLWPFGTFFMLIGSGAKKIMRIKNDSPTLTEDEFAEIVESVGDDGLIEPEETEIIKSAIEFGDLTVSEIMMPRGKISAIPINVSMSGLKKILLEEKYSRFPVYDGNIDHIVGVLQSATCLWKLVKGIPFKMREVLGKPYFVSPDTRLDEVFKEMGQKRTHFAIIRSNEGKTIGIISMEDILEEIVGEIYDEDDDSFAEEGATQ
ncbi:MAG: hemolysin family protein [Eubacteriales bacterium]|nr:hemolysin family protein [Eubacteriales bacterium]